MLHETLFLAASLPSQVSDMERGLAPFCLSGRRRTAVCCAWARACGSPLEALERHETVQRVADGDLAGLLVSHSKMTDVLGWALKRCAVERLRAVLFDVVPSPWKGVPQVPYVREVAQMATAIWEDMAFDGMAALHDLCLDHGIEDGRLLRHLRGEENRCAICRGSGRQNFPGVAGYPGGPGVPRRSGPCPECKGRPSLNVHTRGCWALALLRGEAL